MAITSLKVKLSRACDFIANKAGQRLVLTLSPKTKSIDLQWEGRDAKRSIPIIDLVKGAPATQAPPPKESPPPKEWGTWIRAEDVKSAIATDAELTPQEIGKLMRAIDRVRLHREWLSLPKRPEWGEFLSERGLCGSYVATNNKEKEKPKK